ncbi:MAG: CheR family methyltransferase, partial [Oceanisphaera sp.]
DSYSLLGKFDIIFCRNVLIYFSPANKTKILNQFAHSLNPGGYLLLGASESLTGLSDKFEMIRCNPGIIYRLK